ATRFSIGLRQSYARKGPQTVQKAGRYAHARQMKRMGREVRRLKTWLGRVVRELWRKLPEQDADAQMTLHKELTLAERLMEQQRTDNNKLYSLHEPHTACIAKGKAHKKYEFGSKVSVTTTNREGFVLGMLSFPGNPYDGRTLIQALAQSTRVSGVRPKRCYVDRGYRGHKVTKSTVFISRQKR
ncbi:transposase, partial [Magnetococcus sp. PR-3]|uniref:transposase n=1 Tax=Magnetococcus sp. PR-3 TaxID=3120355 RepID=UPI002FCDE6FD